MDIGKDVLTRTLLGSTEAEKVFTPWWITIHHYLVYTIVILGLIAVPINCMLSVNGNCSYKFSSPGNYILPLRICTVDEGNGIFKVERKHCSLQLKRELKTFLGAEMIGLDGLFEVYNVSNKQVTLDLLKQRKASLDYVTNAQGCLTKKNPRLFGFFVYWSCVNQLSPLALYFPYLVLTLALILVLLERLLTRYLWTGQRIEKFYSLLVKEVMDSGDIEKVDTKENKQKCQQVLYDFRQSWFYCRAYILQTYVKLCICGCVLGWSLLDQCNLLRESFKTEFDCDVFDYIHSCSIPSNGMNLIIFDLCNFVLFLIILDASFNLFWHYRFYGKRSDFIQTKLGRLIQRYEKFQQDLCPGSNTRSSLSITYDDSPDLQMLLNLLAEKEGIWAALIILCLFDRNFRSEFRVRDTNITSTGSEYSSRRKDVTLAWNEPRAASFIGENVPKEHLMYVLEITPPIDKPSLFGEKEKEGGEDSITMMPACAADGKSCVFTPVERKLSDEQPPLSVTLAKLDSKNLEPQTHLDKFKRSQLSRTISDGSSTGRSLSSSSVLSSATTTSGFSSRRTSAGTNHENKGDGITIVDGVHGEDDEQLGQDGPVQRRTSSALRLRRMKTALMLSAVSATGRKRRRTMPVEKVRNFSSVFKGLRSDTDYVITISFVLSSRKLGSESFTILSHDGAGKISSRKHSAASNDPSRRGSIADALATPRQLSSPAISPKTSAVHNSNSSFVLPNNDVPDDPNTNNNVNLDSDDTLISVARDSTDLNETILRLSEVGLVVLEFVASWCGLCNMIAPQIELMAEEFGCSTGVVSTKNGKNKNKYKAFFVRADIEDCSDAAKEYGVQVLPSILLIRHDEVLDSFIGQQLTNVREAMVRIRQEEEEDEEEMAGQREAGKDVISENDEDAANMRMRKVSSALEAVVTDQGIMRTDYER